MKEVDTSALENMLQEAYNAVEKAQGLVLEFETRDRVVLNYAWYAVSRAREWVMETFHEIDDYHQKVADYKGRN